MALRLESVQEVDRLTVTVITDNYYDALRPGTRVSTPFHSKPGSIIHAEHGLSYHVETEVGGISSSLLFDYGMDPMGMSHNVGVLGIDVSKISAMVLSHGHFDHWGGLIGFLNQYGKDIPRGIPFYVGEEAFSRRFAVRPSDKEPQDIGALDRNAIERLGIVEIKEKREPAEIIPGCYITGRVPRVTDYESGNSNLLIQRGEYLEQDFFEGELAMFFAVRGRGLVILSGCAHIGMVNIVKHALNITGISTILAIIGGFHLVNAQKNLVDRYVEDIKNFHPGYIVPTHCTGFEAVTRFAREMPDQFILNTAGTKYTFAQG